MKTINNRADIQFLVHTFYAQIRKDDLLGDIFNSHISEEQWPAHMEKLTDFWETNLFGIPKFKGNPTQKHIDVDRNLKHTTSQEHFGQWLNLWFQTIEAHFEGKIATKAKEAARRMAHGQFIAMYTHRSKT